MNDRITNTEEEVADVFGYIQELKAADIGIRKYIDDQMGSFKEEYQQSLEAQA